jgi:hypothetical protein
MATLMHVDGTDHSHETQAAIVRAANARGGSLVGVTDKGAVFSFADAQAASKFRSAVRSFGVFADETK